MLLSLCASLLADVALSAELPGEPLRVGQEVVVQLDLSLPGPINPHYMWDPGFEPKDLRRPLLLLDVPPSLELLGEVPQPLQTPGDFQLAFLAYPYGRRLFRSDETVRCRVVAEPGPEERLGLNLVAYTGELGTDSREESRFVRLRAELPLKPGARAEAKPSRKSRWGPPGLVQIGDEAPDFDLPMADGERLRLSSFRGEQSVLLIVYRRET